MARPLQLAAASSTSQRGSQDGVGKRELARDRAKNAPKILPQNHALLLLGCNFLLAAGGFLLTIEFLLTLVFGSFFLTAGAFVLRVGPLLLTDQASLLAVENK